MQYYAIHYFIHCHSEAKPKNLFIVHKQRDYSRSSDLSLSKAKE